MSQDRFGCYESGIFGTLLALKLKFYWAQCDVRKIFDIKALIDPLFVGGAKRKVDVDRTTSANTNVSEDVDIAECEKLLKDVNSFDSNKAAVTIPDEVANRHVPEPAKKIRLEEKTVDLDDDDSTDNVDLETMLSAFVDKPNE